MHNMSLKTAYKEPCGNIARRPINGGVARLFFSAFLDPWDCIFLGFIVLLGNRYKSIHESFGVQWYGLKQEWSRLGIGSLVILTSGGNYFGTALLCLSLVIMVRKE